ncbi:uncharacterized protein LOC129232625 [Uloborus diversus]|uniref:uncharacterized protein LOC129232625 n=1 Tax=Uloborus diversus TaxID=327109 RepID=UPI00240A7A6B|nr:uncharacterized protein LOC129232625 [Uloborus diversus]
MPPQLPPEISIRADGRKRHTLHSSSSGPIKMPQKWIFPLLLVAALLTLAMTFDDEYDDDDEEDKALYGDEDKKNNDDEKDNGTRIRIKKRRRPIDLNIRVP